ncbi:MAG: Dps family protein [Holosporales bacterium]|jgi:starvation-inducible DNA-binding protein
MTPNAFLEADQRTILVGALNGVLANTVLLAVKTQNFHWNVTGLEFAALHRFFGELYEELFDAIDDIAERIRALDGVPVGSLKQFLEHATLPETTHVPKAPEMLKILTADTIKIAEIVRGVLHVAAGYQDEVTADLLTERLAAHDKAAWMLASHIK